MIQSLIFVEEPYSEIRYPPHFFLFKLCNVFISYLPVAMNLILAKCTFSSFSSVSLFFTAICCSYPDILFYLLLKNKN